MSKRDGNELAVADTAQSAPNSPQGPTAASNSEPRAPTRELSAGTVLGGRYRIDRLVGRGGMGAVYAAHDTVADRVVAVKLVGGRSEAERARLREELRATMMLTHRNIARTYTLDDVDGELFIVMELLEGQTLAARIGKGAIPRTEALAILSQLCDALAEAHRHKIVHRDVKPGNVMCCSDWRLVLMDFGLARIDDSESITHSTSIKGTPAYMAPEVVAGRRADVRSDIYAVGLILFEMLTGEPPFKAATVDELLHRQLNDSVDTRRLDDVTAKVVARATAKDPSDRYATIDDLRAALATSPDVPRRRPSSLGVVVLGGIATALAAMVAYLLIFRGTTARLEIPPKVAEVHELRPRFEWPQAKGDVFRVVLWRISDIGEKSVIADERNVAGRSWRPNTDLTFLTRYELTVYDERPQMVEAWRFTPVPELQVLLPDPERKFVRNLSPEIRITPFAEPNVYYSFELAETRAFETPIDTGYFGPDAQLQRFRGDDNELNTADDVRYVSWTPNRMLKPGSTYHARIRGYFFQPVDLVPGELPNQALARYTSERIIEFKIAPLGAADVLGDPHQVTFAERGACMPALSKARRLAYVEQLPDGGAEIHVSVGGMTGGTPSFLPGRERATVSVKGSRDLHPSWDLDGQSIWFASDRTDKTFNIWHKRLDSRGYTQLTEFETHASHPSPEPKAAGRVVFSMASPGAPSESTIWVVPRDGKAPLRLGDGEQPSLSPDGSQIAYVWRDSAGNRQLWRMAAEGSNRIQLTSDYDNEQPTWTPDGRHLVFVSNRTGNPDVWSVEVEGARMNQITNHLGADTKPTVSPDGKSIIWCRNIANQSGRPVSNLWLGALL